MIVIMLGPPGSGKGTQSQRLSEILRIPQIATGDIFRALLKTESDLARRVRVFMDAGQLIPDETVVEVVQKRLEQPDCQAGYILDGFPRTAGQAESLMRFLKKRKLKLDTVVSLTVPDDVLIKRLSGRRTCLACGAAYHVDFAPPKVAMVCDRCGAKLVHRNDDQEATIRERLAVYQGQTKPLIEYYQAQGLLKTVDGTVDVDVITKNIQKILKARK